MQMLVPPAQRLPPELTDYIIDFLWESQPDLRACCLVCREWLPSSRRHLFASISYSDGRFLNLLKSPSNLVAIHTRSLDLARLPPHPADTSIPLIVSHLPAPHPAGASIPLIVSHLPGFLQLRSLALGSFLPSKHDFPVLPQVAQLSLERSKFMSCSEFTRFLSRFPTLRELKLSCVTWEDAGPHVFPQLNLELGSFSVQGFQDHSDILPWLHSEDFSPRTRHVTLYISNNATETTLGTTSKYLQHLNGHLNSLRLDLYPSPYLHRNVGLLHLDNLTCLRRLRIGHGIYFYPGPPAACSIFPGVMDITSLVFPRNQLEELVLDVDISEWQRLDSMIGLKNILDRPNIAQIAVIRFHVLRQSHLPAPADVACRQFKNFMRDKWPDQTFVYTQESSRDSL